MQFHYTTPRGNEINSSAEMTEQELRDWDDMLAGYEQWLDDQGIETEEDYLAWQEWLAGLGKTSS